MDDSIDMLQNKEAQNEMVKLLVEYFGGKISEFKMINYEPFKLAAQLHAQ